MKNQFVCDERDYHKYGLIRKIAENATLQIAVCWMLTPDENNNDGNLTKYIKVPEKWEKHDPELFSAMKTIVEANTVDGRKRCTVELIKKSGILPAIMFYDNIVDAMCDDNNADLIFFDPDVGLTPPSGCKEPDKYLQWNEVDYFYLKRNKSLLIFQFLHGASRKQWGVHIKRKCDNIRDRAGADTIIYSFLTDSVVFLLVPNKSHINSFRFDDLKSSLKKTWGHRIDMKEEHAE